MTKGHSQDSTCNFAVKRLSQPTPSTLVRSCHSDFSHSFLFKDCDQPFPPDPTPSNPHSVTLPFLYPHSSLSCLVSTGSGPTGKVVWVKRWRDMMTPSVLMPLVSTTVVYVASTLGLPIAACGRLLAGRDHPPACPSTRQRRYSR